MDGQRFRDRRAQGGDYGYEGYRFDAPQEGGYLLDENNESVNDQLPGHSSLTINAIDGSIINHIIVGY